MAYAPIIIAIKAIEIVLKIPVMYEVIEVVLWFREIKRAKIQPNKMDIFHCVLMPFLYLMTL